MGAWKKGMAPAFTGFTGCKATTKAGTPCKKTMKREDGYEGSGLCYFHWLKQTGQPHSASKSGKRRVSKMDQLLKDFGMTRHDRNRLMAVFPALSEIESREMDFVSKMEIVGQALIYWTVAGPYEERAKALVTVAEFLAVQQRRGKSATKAPKPKTQAIPDVFDGEDD